ncbi:hypothetical protein FXO37_26217 [Capsicum annuum]|nr:hypothetical protein FXO37_26217 [Capsicum annuum]
MDEHTTKTPTNSGIRNMNLVFDALSFSLGLTQEDLVKIISNPLQLKKSQRSKEIRLKFRNDKVKMTEILKKKKKTSSPKEQKTKKRYETKRKSKEIEDDVDKSYANESEEESEEEKKQCVVQAQLCRCIMMLEVKGSSSSGILICANGTSLSFTLREFAIITELNCVANRYDFIFDEGVPNRMIDKYFNGEKIIQKRQLFLAFTEKVWGENNDEDAEKFAILYFLHSFVLSNVETVVIPRLHFDLVDSGRYKNLPWGSLSFEDLARSLNNRLKAGEDECSVDSDDDFQDSPPKKINEHSKKKQKVDSSTLVVKKPSWKKQVNIVDENTKTRTPAPCAAKAAGMKTPVFKPIPTRQVASSKMKKGKQTARAIFPQVQSKPDSHVEKVAVSKPESHVEKEAFIFKKVFYAFRDEVRQEFKGIRQLVKKKFKKMLKAIEQSKQQHEDTDLEAQQMDYAGVETSSQQFSPTIDQNLGENQDATKGCIDLHPDKTNIEIDSQHLIPDELLQSINLDYNISEKIIHHDIRFTIPDELLPSLNAYQRESITTHPSATREEESSDEHFNDKKSESVIQDHCQENKEKVGSRSKSDMHGEVDLDTEEQIMTTPKIQELTIDKQKDEPVWHDLQNTIPDELLPRLNVYSSKSIILHPSREL